MNKYEQSNMMLWVVSFWLLLSLVSPSVYALGPGAGLPNITPSSGYVYRSGIAFDENGDKVFAKYDAEGKYIEDIVVQKGVYIVNQE